MSFAELNRIFAVNAEKGDGKTIMRRFALDEISAVTSPAQKGARMTIMKRDDADAAPIAKSGTVLTSSTNGHAHLIVLDDYTLARGGGYTEEVAELVGERQHWHRHPFVIDKRGNITIGEMSGHSHAAEMAGGKTEKAAPMMTGQPANDSGYQKIAEIDGVRIVRPAPQFGKGMSGAAIDELNALAAEYAAQHGCSIAKAFDALVTTPRGAALYAQTI